MGGEGHTTKQGRRPGTTPPRLLAFQKAKGKSRSNPYALKRGGKGKKLRQKRRHLTQKLPVETETCKVKSTRNKGHSPAKTPTKWKAKQSSLTVQSFYCKTSSPKSNREYKRKTKREN